MSHPKSEEIKIRVPATLKQAIKDIADGRYTSESEIVREAIIAYLTREPELTHQALKETAPSYKTKNNSTAKANAAAAELLEIASVALDPTTSNPRHRAITTSPTTHHC